MKLAMPVMIALIAIAQACSRAQKEPSNQPTQPPKVGQQTSQPHQGRPEAQPDNATLHNLARQKSAEMTKENAERFGPISRQENMAIRLSALPTLQASGEVVGSIISVASNTTIAAYSYRPIKVIAGKSGGIDDCFVVCEGTCWIPTLPEVGGNAAASTPPTIAEICVPESKLGFYFRADRSADTNAQLVFYSDGFNIQPVFGGLGSKHTFKATVLK